MSEAPPGRSWQAEDGLHVDTRGLPPPDPLVAILWHVAHHAGPFTVHMDRNPVHLYPELAELGWQADLLDPTPGEVRLIVRPAR